MPQAPEGPRNVKRVKRKQSVGKAISSAPKKPVNFGPAPKKGAFKPVPKAKVSPGSAKAGVGAPAKGKVKLKKKRAGVLEAAATRAAGVVAPSLATSISNPKNPVTIVGKSTAITTVKQPKRTVKDTAKAAVGIPAGIARMVLNPKESAKGIVADYKRRYAPALKGDYDKFHKRQLKEGSVPELLDASIATTGTGAAVGRAAQRAATAGSLGKAAKRVATQETKLRVSGGEGGVVTRKPSKNLLRNIAADRQYKRRARVQAKRAARPEASGIVREAEAANKAAGRVVEVTPVRRRKAKRAQVRSVASDGGVALQRMKGEQHREVLSTKTGTAASLKGLSKDEKAGLKYAAQYGIRDAEGGRRVLKKHRERVASERAKREAEGNPVRPIVDELPEIDRLIENADKVFTPNLRRVVKTEGNRSRKLAHRDPAMADDQALRRAYQPAAELFDVKPVAGESAKQFVRRVRQKMNDDTPIPSARVRRPSKDRAVPRIVSKPGEQPRVADVRLDKRGFDEVVPGSERPLSHVYRAVSEEEYQNAVKNGYLKSDGRRNLVADEGTVASMDNPAFYLPNKGEGRILRIAVRDGDGWSTNPNDGYIKTQKPIPIDRVEGSRKYVDKKPAPRSGTLGSAAYFKSQEIPQGVHAMFAKGGSRAVQGEKKYTGALTRTGRESSDPQILVRSNAQNIKRKYNWNLVGDTVDKHVFKWSREKKYTAHELQKEITRKGIDPESVALWNPRLYRERAAAVAKAEDGPDADVTFTDKSVHTAASEATASLDDLALDADRFKVAGWQVAPKDVIEEVMDTARSNRGEAIGRAYDISKGQISRILLANPAWLGFQVGSNTLMAGLAGVSPADVARSMRFYKKMDPETRATHEALFGVHGWFKEQRRMGAAGGRFTQAWNAVKDTPFYQKALEGKSPFDTLFFRPDNAQNNMFRRALMYNRLKKETYAAINRDASSIVVAQNRLLGALKGNPEKQMLQLAKNRKVVEEHAKAVDDFLGNWTRYTARERKVFSRFVMFYGFFRFSTRLAFYTMPVEHPLMSSILLQVGRLEKDEIERIFGTEPPPWEYGNFYGTGSGFGKDVDPKTANRIPTTRLVPFFNALQYGNPSAVVGSLAPPVGILANQLAGKNVALDQPYKINKSTAYVQRAGDLSLKDRFEIAVSEAAKLSPYVRAAEAATLRGKQGSDSSIFFPQPTEFKRADAKKRNAKLVKKQNARGVGGAVQETLAPQFGTDGSKRIEDAKSFNKSRAKKKVKKKKSSPWGSSGWG